MKIKNKIFLSVICLSALNVAQAITIQEAATIALEEALAAEEAAEAAAAAAIAEQEIRDGISAFNDSNSLTKNQTSITGSVTSNDSGAISASLSSQPATSYGTLSFSSNGAYTYTLNSNSPAVAALESGEYLNDLFSYQITGQKGYTDSAILTIQILGTTNTGSSIDDTFFAFDDENSLDKNTNQVSGDATSNDTGGTTYSLVSSPSSSYGSLIFLSDGTYTYNLNISATEVANLKQGEFLTDTFTYKMESFGKSVTADIIIRIVGKDDTIDENFYAFDDENSIIKNSTTINGSVTTNDSGGITFSLSSSPISNFGSLVFQSDGSYTYRLNNNASEVQNLQLGEFLTDTFTYSMLGVSKSLNANLIIRIIGKTGSLTDEEEAAAQAEEEAKEEELKAFFTVDDLFSIIKSDNDEASITITGNVLSNDSNVNSVSLNSLPIGLYGLLQFDNSGVFTYTLNSQSTAVQQLSNSGFLDDVFTYTANGISSSTGEALSTTGKLTIRILSTSWSRDQNVEIEPNDTTLNSTQVNSGQLIKGHLQTSDDKDIYKIQSSGDEIIHIELCPQGEICEKIGAWALYVFDGDLFPAEEFNAVILKRYVTDGTLAFVNNNNLVIEHSSQSVTCSGRTCNEIVASGYDDHMYLVKKSGLYDNSLIGVIDPQFGDANSVDIGVGPGAKTYYIAISSVLIGDGSDTGEGKLIHERAGKTVQGPSKDDPPEDIDKATTEEFTVVFPANRDQYSISITSTGVNPLQSTRTLASTFNPATKVLLIPEIQVAGESYAAELALQGSARRSGAYKFDLLNMAKIEEELQNNIPATYDPETHRVRIPKYIDDFGVAYSVDLLYHPAKNGQAAFVELIKMDIIE